MMSVVPAFADFNMIDWDKNKGNSLGNVTPKEFEKTVLTNPKIMSPQDSTNEAQEFFIRNLASYSKEEDRSQLDLIFLTNLMGTSDRSEDEKITIQGWMTVLLCLSLDEALKGQTVTMNAVLCKEPV